MGSLQIETPESLENQDYSDAQYNVDRIFNGGFKYMVRNEVNLMFQEFIFSHDDPLTAFKELILEWKGRQESG